MMDLMLTGALCRALQDGVRLIFAGDADQLPSVGAGNVLRDMIASECIPTIRLREIFRQAEGSGIVANSHLINSGEYPAQQSPEKTNFAVEKADRKTKENGLVVKDGKIIVNMPAKSIISLCIR